MEILEGLKKHLEKEKASFHMPGHKNGAAFFGMPIYNEIFKLDTTELAGTDCLYLPEDFILRAQKKAADCFFADEAFFLVNGASSGILSMFYSAFKEGDRVIVDRNCHKSAVSAMALSGVCPIYISPEKNEEIGCAGKISPEKIENLFKKYTDIKGVYITSPNYYGICSDLEKIAEIAHKNGACLLVDEAHGAHFPFSHHFPKTAAESGADLSVVSLHKSLAAPNQTALLCKKGNRVSSERLKMSVNIFQTTSPSYILMAYADAAISIANESGEELTERLLEYKKGIKTLKTDDPFKLIVSFRQKGISGEELDKIFREKFGIYSELYDHANVLLMSSWGNTKEDFDLLRKACDYVSALPDKTEKSAKYPQFESVAEGIPPKDIIRQEGIFIPLKSAFGRISIESITTFPPCIPIILPGEKIKEEHIEFLLEFKGKVSGIKDGMIRVL